MQKFNLIGCMFVAEWANRDDAEFAHKPAEATSAEDREGDRRCRFRSETKLGEQWNVA